MTHKRKKSEAETEDEFAMTSRRFVLPLKWTGSAIVAAHSHQEPYCQWLKGERLRGRGAEGVRAGWGEQEEGEEGDLSLYC